MPLFLTRLFAIPLFFIVSAVGSVCPCNSISIIKELFFQSTLIHSEIRLKRFTTQLTDPISPVDSDFWCCLANHYYRIAYLLFIILRASLCFSLSLLV